MLHRSPGMRHAGQRTIESSPLSLVVEMVLDDEEWLSTYFYGFNALSVAEAHFY